MNWDLIKIKNLSFVKDPLKRMKKKLQTGRKYLQTTLPTKDLLVSRTYKNLSTLNSKKQSNQKTGKIHEKTFHHRGNIDGK